MEEVIVKVYKYDELSDKAKEVARQWYAGRVFDYEWWDSIYDDAKTVGIEIDSFDLDRNRHAKGKNGLPMSEVARLILENHGKDCSTYKMATQFLADVAKMPCEDGDDDTSEMDARCAQFLYDILEDYSQMLQDESEYMTSEEYLKEGIEANKYDFTEDGKRF